MDCLRGSLPSVVRLWYREITLRRNSCLSRRRRRTPSYMIHNTSHRHAKYVRCYILNIIQLDCRSFGRTQIFNLPTSQKGYDTFETTIGKLSARRIQIFWAYFCLGNILKVILNIFRNNAQTKKDRSDSDSPRRIP